MNGEPLTRITYTDVDGSLLAELRGDGCETMMPGSTHPSGERVKYVEDGDPLTIETPKLIESFGRLAAATMLVRSWNQWASQHHTLTLHLAGGMLRGGLDPEWVETFVRIVCLHAGEPDREDRARAVRNTAAKIEGGDNVSGFRSLADIIGIERVKKLREWLGIKRDSPSLTDTGNAERLIHLHGEDIRYCKPLGGWLVYHGGRWVRDDLDRVFQYAKETALAIPDEKDHMEAKDEEDRVVKHKGILSHAIKSLDMRRLEAMVKAAHFDPDVVTLPDYFDQGRYLFNVGNGTLNLQTGGISPHNRDDHLMKISPVIYDRKATCPKWDAFLTTVMDSDLEMVQFLKMLTGYCLTADTREQALFIPFGDGSNGKTTFLEILATVLGSYFVRLPTETLMLRGTTDRIPNDIARLQGARLAITNETNQNHKLNEEVVKNLTGDDTITARYMRGEFFDFRPSHKLILYGNSKPVITETTEGIWRRIRLIPFSHTFAQNDPTTVKGYGDVLRTELSGILNWAIEGCLDWQQNGGLTTPEAVRKATNAYRSEMDTLGDFLRECCVRGDAEKVAASELYESYSGWCRHNGYTVWGGRKLGGELRSRGIPLWESNGKSYRRGIDLTLTGEGYRNGYNMVDITKRNSG